MYRLYYLFLFMLTASLSVFGQCVDKDAHNTSIGSNWVSCETSTNPLSYLPSSHWILYEFEEVSSISGMKLWNINNPDYLATGVRDIRIDISIDGASWESVDTISLEMAPGHPDYIGQDLEQIEGIEAKYVLMTLLSNYGAECTGIAEAKFVLGDVNTSTVDVSVNTLKLWPNPADQKVTIGLERIDGRFRGYQITDMLGRTVAEQDYTASPIGQELEIKTNHLSDGQYIISIVSDKGHYNESIIIVHPN